LIFAEEAVRKGSSLRCGHGAVTDNRPILAAGRSRLGIGSLERPIDRLKQELAASQRRFAKQQQRLETTLGSPRGHLVRSNRPRRLQAAHALAAMVSDPGPINSVKRHDDTRCVGSLASSCLGLSLVGTRRQ